MCSSAGSSRTTHRKYAGSTGTADAIVPVTGGGAGARRARRAPSLVAWCLLLGTPACGEEEGPQGPGQTPGSEALELTRVVSGLDGPVFLTAPPGDPRLFVVEQPGRIRIIADATLRADPFLDISSRVQAGGERGLLGLAFHPDYASNGRFYVHYTRLDGNSRIARFEVSADPDSADAASETPVLQVFQPFANHNGGMIAFGPGGELFIGLGDGGSGGDPQANGQNVDTLLGALLRIDVDAAEPYAIPAGNPFAADGGRPEIWAWGLRNPWRFAIDETEGRLWIADVGQSRAEELNRQPLDAAGVNYGWNVMEGLECFQASSCDTGGLATPLLEYEHGPGCSVIGGFVYRGDGVPELRGEYLFSDFCAGFVRSVPAAAATPTVTDWDTPELGRVLSFGRDADGELYILTQAGDVWRIDGVG